MIIVYYVGNILGCIDLSNVASSKGLQSKNPMLLKLRSAALERAYSEIRNKRIKLDEEISKGNPPIQDPKFAGYCERRATTVKKLAMLICAMDGNKYIITENLLSV